MLGAMPADFLVFEVGEEPPAAESVDNDEDDTAGSKNVWDVNKRSVVRSVPRILIGTYYPTQKHFGKSKYQMAGCGRIDHRTIMCAYTLHDDNQQRRLSQAPFQRQESGSLCRGNDNPEYVQCWVFGGFRRHIQ